MMTVYCLLDTGPAIHMTASSDVAVSDWIETDCTLKLGFELLWTYLKVNMVLLFDHHCGIFIRLKD